MKNLLTLFVLFLGLGMANAQTEEETLEWLNTKKTEVTDVRSLTVWAGQVIFSLSIVKAYTDDGASTTIEWKTVKDIKIDGEYVQIVDNNTYQGRTSYIRFYVGDKILRDKYAKALKHMATLKGAKLVNDDLF